MCLKNRKVLKMNFNKDEFDLFRYDFARKSCYTVNRKENAI